ncbi:MAG: hypothetical protein IPH37_01180 [Burkholderiales bacterium]|nr:hypothetical protein [Burkholderiales bacterium]MBK9345843.1 hypothetical protein [Burkholderiales bacterium]
MNDEIIKALHATKEHLAQDAGLDIKRLIESVQREEAISASLGRIIVQPPATNQAPSVFQQIRFAHH